MCDEPNLAGIAIQVQALMLKASAKELHAILIRFTRSGMLKALLFLIPALAMCMQPGSYRQVKSIAFSNGSECLVFIHMLVFVSFICFYHISPSCHILSSG